MNTFKNAIYCLALSILGTLCICLVILQSSVLLDCATDADITHSYESKLMKLGILHQDISLDDISESLSTYVYEGDYNQLEEWANLHCIAYTISTSYGRPVSTSSNWYKKSPDTTILTVNVEKDQDLYIIKACQILPIVEDDTSLFPNIWVFFSSHIALTIGLLILTLVLGIVCFWQILLNASAFFKLCLFMLYLFAADLIFLFFAIRLTLPYFVLYFALEKLFLILVIGNYLRQLKKLHRNVQAICNTDIQETKALSSFPLSLRPFAKDVDQATDRIHMAIEQRMKSDRLKTELITNVSHDIKTPLTSIINFSDMISREQTENETITEYASHLHAQSIRLKSLLESLIEASKASSGAVEIQMVPCKVGTVLEQCVVEYVEKLSAHQIELVDLPSEEELMISADPNALCRIFDNLLTNICKYALPGSRAYLEVSKEQNLVQICFKNVSREACNLSADELTERFVRGDSSRHSDGHGLGLSIVKSLLDLMNGSLEISCQYDIFEIKLLFPILEA